MNWTYVVGFLFLALLNALAAIIIWNPAIAGIVPVQNHLANPLVLLNIGIVGLVTVLSLASSIAFLLNSKHAYTIGLSVSVLGLLTGLISLNIIGLLFYGALTYELYNRRKKQLNQLRQG